MPTISIIVPIYNAQRTLHRCVNSILRSTFQDFELILVEDCSTDNSKSICEDYVRNNEGKVKLIALSHNSGVSAARNAGIEAAEGKYLMFADSDDYVAKNWCEALYKTQCQYPESMVVCNLSDVKLNGRQTNRGSVFNGSIYLMQYYELFNIGCSGSLCNKIYKRDVIVNHNITLDPSLVVGEDVVFNVDYAKVCKSVVYIETPLYFYCEVSDSATHRYHEDWLQMHLLPFYVRVPLIGAPYINKYCESWFPFFIAEFENIFDKRCKKSFIEKMRYNHKVMQSKEFRFCAEHISGGKESKLFMSVVKTYNYYLLWLFQRGVSLKRLLKRNN